MTVLDSQMLKVALGEDQRPEIVIDDLEQSSGGSNPSSRRTHVVVAPVPVHSNIVFDAAATGSAESLDREHVALLHPLRGPGLDEGDLFLAVDLVAQDVVTSEASDCFDGNDFAVELDFVAFHGLLHDLADVIDPGVNASFLC